MTHTQTHTNTHKAADKNIQLSAGMFFELAREHTSLNNKGWVCLASGNAQDKMEAVSPVNQFDICPVPTKTWKKEILHLNTVRYFF